MRVLPILFAIAAASAPAIAFAAPGQTSAQAEALFQEGIDLVDKGQAALGCPKLEESERLDPQVGTEFRLADCYERIGRTATAWALFVQVQGKVETPEEIKKAKGRVDALEPKLTRIRIQVPDAVASLPELEVQRDGVVVGRASWTTAAPIDPGEHTIRVTAQGKEPWEKHVRVEAAGATVDVPVPSLDGAKEAGAKPGLHPRRGAGIVIGAVGLVGLAVGGSLAGLAAVTWSHAQDLCPSKLGCSTEAHDESATALSLADGSTAMFVVGGALAATGIILFAIPAPQASTTDKTAVWFAPSLGGASLGGRF